MTSVDGSSGEPKQVIGFVHIPKTAGITVNRMLRNSFGTAHLDVQSWESFTTKVTAADVHRLRFIYPDLRSIAGHHLTVYGDLASILPGVRYLTFLRDPIRRTASFYQYQVQKMGLTIPFEEWISRPLQHDVQVKRIAGDGDVETAKRFLQDKFDFVGLTERFDESAVIMGSVFAGSGIDIHYRRSNVAADNRIKDGLIADRTSRSLLEEANESDIHLYRYVADQLFPAQVDRYAGDLAADVAAFGAENEGYRWSPRYYSNVIWRNLLYKPWLAGHRFLRRRSL